MDSAFLQDRITAVKAMIVAYETAILQLSTGTIKSFTLNTGQTVETVNKKDVARLQAALESLYNTLEVMCARINGGSIIVIPE